MHDDDGSKVRCDDADWSVMSGEKTAVGWRGVIGHGLPILEVDHDDEVMPLLPLVPEMDRADGDVALCVQMLVDR